MPRPAGRPFFQNFLKYMVWTYQNMQNFIGNSNFLSKVSQIWLKSRFISVFLIFFQTFSKNRFKHVRICRILWRSRFFGPNDPKYSPNINFYQFYKKSDFYDFYKKFEKKKYDRKSKFSLKNRFFHSILQLFIENCNFWIP